MLYNCVGFASDPIGCDPFKEIGSAARSGVKVTRPSAALAGTPTPISPCLDSSEEMLHSNIAVVVNQLAHVDGQCLTTMPPPQTSGVLRPSHTLSGRCREPTALAAAS